MKTLKTSISTVAFSIAGILAMTVVPRAWSEPGSQANAQALLDEAKQSEFDRRLATKQTELDRLGEDEKKGKMEMETLERSVTKVTAAASESKAQIDHLAAEKKRLTQELDVVNLRMEAEKLKEEGLRLLAIAHTKAREALSKRTEELNLRTAVVAAEMRQLSGKTSAEPAPSTGKKGAAKVASPGPGITDLRKQLAKAEQATINASSNARQAMEAATAKLQQAEAAAAKTDKKKAEVSLERNPSFPGGNDPLSTANQ